ncbi:uncharacterized protein LOC115875450 [Sitophilus oryzae]|uniref:Uncharacterized protein LOC115875450 n=1 Tax=Sitophilus oryzae TaxID=7048 RepID=A0A6J2X6H3_SITOR|nr:uncharacterized protein LOC115875450 [Sitophilus oryzae]
MWNNWCFFILLLYFGVLNITNGYDTPQNPQYHIQTDEGPERYFRYQTLSGQFRKEKRLEDGTVIGTYAWIDDDGILRQRDYIADTAGYRILKSKNLYVGRNLPVAEAMKLAKKYPASAGTLVSSKASPSPVRPVVTVAYNQAISQSTTPRPVTPLPTVSTTTGIPCASCNTPGPTTVRPDGLYVSSTFGPHVEISNNALPSSTIAPFISTTEKPYVEITPGTISSTLAPFVSTTVSPVTGLPLEYLKTDVQAVNNLQFHETSTIRPAHQLPSAVQYSPSPYDALPTYTESDQNTLDANPYVSPINQGYLFHNGPTYPIDRNGHTYRGTKRYSNARIGNGYDKQYPEYDGVSVTNDGFRYYIPRAYHEEQTGVNNEKSGSFGYIDPFGIRRVIYYNAKPGEGFQHRKNNRYVGFDATPYDPRPY